MAVLKTLKRLWPTIVGYAVFLGLGLGSREVPALFLLMVAVGLVAPVLLVRREHPRRTLGYTRRHLRSSILWGLGIGAVMTLFSWWIYGRQPVAGEQLLVGVPAWLLILSPFQENVFRGWMQPRLAVVLGPTAGLLVTALAFSLWHLAPPLTQTSTSDLPVTDAVGLAFALALGVLTGVARQRTDSMVGPWLGHALAGIALVALGHMTFVQYQP